MNYASGPAPKLQYTAKKNDGQRCTGIAQHFTGKQSLCNRHHLVWMADKQKEKK